VLPVKPLGTYTKVVKIPIINLEKIVNSVVPGGAAEGAAEAAAAAAAAAGDAAVAAVRPDAS
jgi:hypothetical protein